MAFHHTNLVEQSEVVRRINLQIVLVVPDSLPFRFHTSVDLPPADCVLQVQNGRFKTKTRESQVKIYLLSDVKAPVNVKWAKNAEKRLFMQK